MVKIERGRIMIPYNFIGGTVVPDSSKRQPLSWRVRPVNKKAQPLERFIGAGGPIEIGTEQAFDRSVPSVSAL